MSEVAKQISNHALLIAVVVLLLLGYTLYDISFYRHHHLSGWLLVYLIVAQMLYYTLKKSDRLRKSTRIRWLELHAEFGWIAVLVLLVHIGWSIPDGGLGMLLIACFTGVALSGVLGLRIKQSYQTALALRSGREMPFHEIPEQLKELELAANKLVLQCASKDQPSMLVDYYRDKLSGQLSTPGNVVAQLTGRNQAWLEHFANIERLLPYLPAHEANSARELIKLLRKKNNLDYHYAHQGALRIWLLIHVPFAVSLTLLAVLHMVLVYAFSGTGFQ